MTILDTSRHGARSRTPGRTPLGLRRGHTGDMGLDVAPPDWQLLRDWMVGQGRTPAWQEAGLWALTALEEELGPRWVERTWLRLNEVPGGIIMAGFSLFAYVERLELATRLKLLRDVDGYDRLLRNLKRNPVPDETAHLRAQLQVAALALHTNALTSLEPTIKGTKSHADVELALNGDQVLAEVAVIRRPDEMVNAGQWFDRVSHEILGIELSRGVSVDAEFDAVLADEQTEALLASLDAAAGFVSKGGVVPPIVQSGVRVTVSRSKENRRVRGPSTTWDSGARLDQTILSKARQMRDAHRVWIVIHLVDGIFYSEPWIKATVLQKLEALTARIRPLIEPHRAVEGVVVENGAIFVDLRQDDEPAEYEGAYGLRHSLPPVRHRELMVIPRAPNVPSVQFWRDAYRNEPRWLDWALERFGLPTPEAIFAPAR